jgi:hypothetical protein
LHYTVDYEEDRMLRAVLVGVLRDGKADPDLTCNGGRRTAVHTLLGGGVAGRARYGSYSTPATAAYTRSVFPSPWRIYFTFGGLDWIGIDVHQRLSRIVPNAEARQALSLPVNAIDEALPLLDPVYAHYVAQWPKIVPWSEENEFGRGFFLEGSALPDQIADPSHADELDDIFMRSIPDDVRRRWEGEEGDPPCALSVCHRLIEWDPYMSSCAPAAELGIEPYPG